MTFSTIYSSVRKKTDALSIVMSQFTKFIQYPV